MTSWDLSLALFYNSFVHRLYTLDSFMLLIVDSHLFKGGIIAAIMWVLWFRTNHEMPYHREKIVAILSMGLVAALTARSLALLLPFQTRPIHTVGLVLQQPYNMGLEKLEGWSSFPSDHAALFFAMATGIFFISRKVGIITFLYVTFFVCVPRLYLGLHWTTDIIGGALIGCLFGSIAAERRFHLAFHRPLNYGLEHWPWIVYAGLFLMTFETANLYINVRQLIKFTYNILRHFLGGIV